MHTRVKAGILAAQGLCGIGGLVSAALHARSTRRFAKARKGFAACCSGVNQLNMLSLYQTASTHANSPLLSCFTMAHDCLAYAVHDVMRCSSLMAAHNIMHACMHAGVAVAVVQCMAAYGDLTLDIPANCCRELQ